MTDLFLSYNRADAAQAVALDAWLRGQGCTTFFDRRDLGGGRLWLPDLEAAISQAAGAIAVLVGPAGLGNTQQYEYQLALTRQAAEPDFRIIPVILPGTPAWRWPRGFLALKTWISFADVAGLGEKPEELQRLLAATRRLPAEDETVRGLVCPFRGLDVFEEEDHRVFLGRDAEAATLHATVRDHRVAAVLGRSGSGKSSLARAGLLPRLRARPDTGWTEGVWDRLTLRPGRAPLEALAEALEPKAAGEHDVDFSDRLSRHAKVLRGQSDDFLAELLHRRLAASRLRSDRLLLLVDQGEELFARPFARLDAAAQKQFQTDTERFITLILAAARTGPASVVLTMRSDFFDPLMHSAFEPLLENAMVTLGRVADLRPCIEAPAALVGLRYSPGLVDRIIGEVGADEGNLPLLQHALQRTWAPRRGPLLSDEAYVEAGGVAQAINRQAKACFDELSSDQRNAARSLFLRLVSPGTLNAHIRQRAPVPADPLEREVLEIFASPKHRLLYVGAEGGMPTVEVAHEALIRGWGTLLEWVEASRERLRTRDDILHWRNQSREGSAVELIPPGSLLARAKELLADPGDVPVDAIAAYIAASVEAADRAVRKEIEAAEQVAQERLEAAERTAREREARLEAEAILQRQAAAAAARTAEEAQERARLETMLASQKSVESEMRERQTRLELEAQLAAQKAAAAEREVHSRLEAARRAALAQARITSLTRRALGVVTVLCIAVFGLAYYANTQREQAEQSWKRAEGSAAVANDAAKTLIERVAEALGGRAGVPTELVAQLLDEAGKIIEKMQHFAPDDTSLLELQARTQMRFSTTFMRQGNGAFALENARSARDIIARLVASQLGNASWRRDLSFSHARIGDTLRDLGDLAGALEDYREAAAIAEWLVDAAADNGDRQRELSLWRGRIGNVLLAQGELNGADVAYTDSVAIARHLAELNPGKFESQRDLSIIYGRIGDLRRNQREPAKAVQAYRASLAMAACSNDTDPANGEWQRDLSASYEAIGDVLAAQGDIAGALEAYRSSRSIIAGLAVFDPRNALWIRAQPGDGRESLPQASDPRNARWIRDLSTAGRRLAGGYEKFGEKLEAQGNIAAALEAYRDSRSIMEALAASDSGNARLKIDLEITNQRIRDLESKLPK
jgi:tetratricopeptide (TPR) repeat protein